MSDGSKIEWTDATWNFLHGCTPVSSGCANCYAVRSVARLEGAGHVPKTLTHKGRWTGQVNVNHDKLTLPLSWKKSRRIFVNSLSDLFHEDVPDVVIDRAYAVMWSTQWHTFQILTKRPARRLAYLTRPLWAQCVSLQAHALMRSREKNPEKAALVTVGDIAEDLKSGLPNVWEGVSVEDQTTADERIPTLLKTPAAVRFVSYEPALGPVDFLGDRRWLACPACDRDDCTGQPINWLIVGGESGPGARPCNMEWIRDAVDDCRAADIPVFVKQFGAQPFISDPDSRVQVPTIGMRAIIKDPKGGNPAEWPEDLRVREFPQQRTGLNGQTSGIQRRAEIAL